MATLRLIVGDDWDEIPVAITDNNGDPYDLSGNTITGEVQFRTGTITLTIDIVSLVGGTFTFSASDILTNDLPFGLLSVAKFTAVNGSISKTLFCVNVEGVKCL